MEPWLGLVYSPLLIAFGIGIWRSAQGSRALRVIGGLQILGAAVAPLWWLFGEASLAMVVAFNGLALAYAPEVSAGEPTPFIGLYERIAFSAYFLWLTVLAVALWRRPAIKDHDGELQDRTQASARA